MKIVFRTDASSQIGTGHFMRCLTLADQLKKKGAHIHFICRDLPAHLSEILKSRDMEYIPLSTDVIMDPIDELAHSSWLGTSQTQDAQATVKALASQSWDWIIVDHYALDERWERTVRANCKKLMVIDDLADRQHVCDVLLDQNFYADMQIRYSGKVPEQCQLLIGPRYALLREEFRALRKYIKPRSGEVKKILIFFGGVDADNYTSLAIKVLAELECKQQVDVVIGAQHPNREQIKQACAKYGYACHVQTTRMAELMAKADLAIGAGGSATWERCCLGLPSLLVAFAENQINITKNLDLIGACIYTRKLKSTIIKITSTSLDVNLKNQHQLMAISRKAYSLVDGLGAVRVMDQIIDSKHISILVDHDSWILPYAKKLEIKLKTRGHSVQFIRESKEICEGWINFMLGCTKIIREDLLKRNRHNLVIHESYLPKGRGFAPMAWQIIEGRNKIPICLIEAEAEPDSGVIWIRDEIELNGSELCDEWRALQGEKTVELCCRFVEEYETLKPQLQIGEQSQYERRRPQNSKLDIKKNIQEQFCLLRTVDNERYPAFFEFAGKRYILKIYSVDDDNQQERK
jgi:UDP-2,4-diacetamido-2,4,6-trideoxy-beta-L-altropyranose hydrolase